MTVENWLKRNSIPSSDIQSDGEWTNFILPISKAEFLLNTTFNYYARPSSEPIPEDYRLKQYKRIIVRTLQYSLPKSIIPHIATIQPTTRFVNPQPQRDQIFKTTYAGTANGGPTAAGSTDSAAANLSPLAIACNYGQTITPDCLRTLYNISSHHATPNIGSLFGVCGYLKEYAKYASLSTFLHRFAPYAIAQNFTYTLITGGLSTQNDTVDDDFEANLDIEYAASLGYGQDITYYSTGGLGLLVPDLDQPVLSADENEPYLNFLTYILGLEDWELPQTITSSYGEDEQSVPGSYATKVCDMFGELGMRGVSVVFSR